ncbi:Type III flagellar switch regulator (C-ring) FliN C-term [Erythrobacter sp. HL-111]|nr:MAG: flagellar motor switch protein FliM [Erythrobacteraceae bacterium HL-111]SDS93183.1 Type III flagellar switch regulator (C-ring) FliN C-term [Erythrobacter sp. HL-111]
MMPSFAPAAGSAPGAKARARFRVRRPARHCDELVRRGPRPEERAGILALWRRDLALTLARELGALLPGDSLAVTVSEPELLRGSDALARIGPLAANSLLRCGDAERTALLSFTFATAIALTDRSFGGEGEVACGVPDGAGAATAVAPDRLPRSAALLIDRVAAIVARALAAGSGDGANGANGTGIGPESEAGVILRSESAGRLKPFAPDAPAVLLTLSLANAEGREWDARLALAERVFEALLPGTAAPRPARRARSARAGAAGAPFGAIPLALEGVLAEFELSLARLGRLAPGDTIALAVPGELPLRIGERVVGWGRLGTLGDRLAIRLTRLPDAARRAPGDASQGDSQ